MEKISSFQVDHDRLLPGLYISRIDFEDIVTYDLRVKQPNQGDYLDPAVAHTWEHILATAIRNGELGSGTIYFGPMGCLTGFYLILKGVPSAAAIAEIRRVVAFLRDFEGEIPGSRRVECGNYAFHDLDGAKREAGRYWNIIQNWTEEDLYY